ncbi:hypothetical protein Tco_1026765 [Tanacetum coccineum]
MNEIGKLRAISGHVLRASGVQIPQNNLDIMQLISEEEDGETKVSDPRDILGFILLAVIDFATLEEWDPIGTLLVAVNLVKGHAFPTKAKKQIGRIVRIKSLLDAVGITVAQVYVNTALMKLVLLMNFKKIFQVVTTAGIKVNAVSES